jgi:hypothetical protein
MFSVAKMAAKSKRKRIAAARIGGRASAALIPRSQRIAMGIAGGRAAAKLLTPKERRARASHAAGSITPDAAHERAIAAWVTRKANAQRP